jgi:predicted anti-sigma-YlaC factor YlaD
VFFPVVRSLKLGAFKRNLSRSLAFGASGVAALFYTIIGLFGYLAADRIQRAPLSNIILQIDLSLIGFQIAAVAMLINLVLNFGLFFLSAREV